MIHFLMLMVVEGEYISRQLFERTPDANVTDDLTLGETPYASPGS
jgi:hypothetical protein